MLIGGDDVSDDIINLGTCFSMLVSICNRFHFPGQVRSGQWTGSHRRIGGGIQILEM